MKSRCPRPLDEGAGIDPGVRRGSRYWPAGTGQSLVLAVMGVKVREGGDGVVVAAVVDDRHASRRLGSSDKNRGAGLRPGWSEWAGVVPALRSG